MRELNLQHFGYSASQEIPYCLRVYGAALELPTVQQSGLINLDPRLL